MANCGKDILSSRKGTSQMQRYIDALNPSAVKLNDFSLKEWLQFAFSFAKHVNYYDTTNSEMPLGNWRDFFMDESELENFLNQESYENVTPHLALFISFIKLLEFPKKRFNRLTKKHLDFYYRRVLHLEKLPATPDKVHLIFELAKTIVSERIPQEIMLDGGKDGNGVKRIYKTAEEIAVNRSAVSSLMSVYNHENQKLKAAPIANSYDGMGADFPNEEIKWWPFGYYGDTKYPELPDAKVGFALSSEVLELQEGQRNILLNVEFTSAISAIGVNSLHENIEIYCSGEKEWLGPFLVQPDLKDNNGNVIFSSGISPSGKVLKLAFSLPKEADAVFPFNSAILEEPFETSFPVCRVIIKTENSAGIEIYRKLVGKTVKSCKIDIDVRGVKSLAIESDIGNLNPEKPFYPFSTQPVKKSNFYVGYPELFKKSWTELEFEIEWKNTPENFRDLYYAYRNEYIYNVNSDKFMDGMFDWIEALGTWELKTTTSNLIVNNNSYFKADVQLLNKEEWEVVEENHVLFNQDGEGFNTIVKIINSSFDVGENGPVRLSLKQSFLHELFPRIYALAFTSDDSSTLIPNEPYTPMVESVTLNYKAEAVMNLGASEQDFNTNPVVLFHEHPFGNSHEHPWLKNQFDFLPAEDKKISLVPNYGEGGELYIGLDNVVTQQQLSLLVQVFEGSENPLADTFTGDEKAEWSILCRNEWMRLDAGDMIKNETDNFLKSGIVKFSVPKEATQNNTKLPPEQVWLKVKIHKNYDAVCKSIAIFAQAVIAVFEDNGNDLEHLVDGLPPATISKMIQRVATIKSVSQPFSSFDGRPEETDENYYRRVSERLRHKNRAITLWDYEQIILQEFPQVHKVKCLNHTSDTSFLSPGNVYLIVIPDIVNKNVFDIYQPRVSRALLNAIQDHVNKLNSCHVNAQVFNPDYEEVTVSLKVKFHPGYDAVYYLNELNTAITQLLSPWAFKNTAPIDFGATLHLSLVINYIEGLEYVDYLEDVKLIKGTESGLTRVTPSSPKAILVSARQHDLSTNVKGCLITTETEKTCQT